MFEFLQDISVNLISDVLTFGAGALLTKLASLKKIY
jgi:hypothetical protein